VSDARDLERFAELLKAYSNAINCMVDASRAVSEPLRLLAAALVYPLPGWERSALLRAVAVRLQLEEAALAQALAAASALRVALEGEDGKGGAPTC